MEGKGSYSSIRFSLAGLFLIIGHASAGGYGSFGSFGGASAVSSASASASSSSTSNSWQGGAQLGPGSHGSGAVAGGNPLISNSVKGASYDVDFNKFSDDLSGIKQGIAGLVGEVLGSVKQFNENIHGGGSALDGGCKTGNCGKNIFLIPGLSGGNHGGAGGSYGFGGSFGEANAGASSFAGATAPFGIGLNKNCGGPLCNNDAGNVRLHSQAPHQPKCSSPSCSQGNNAQTGQGIFPGSATPVHKVQRYPTTSSKPLPIQPQSCNGPFCRDSKNYGGINNYPSGIIPPQKVHSNPSSPKHPSSCRGPACQKNNKSPSIDRPHKANTPSAIASVHFVNSNPTSQTNISPAYLPPCNGPYCISGPNPHNPGIPPNPPKHFTPNVHPPCNGPNCGGHTNGKNPFLPDPTGTNPQNGPGDWHPVFNPNPNICFGPRCSAKKPPNQSCSGYQCNNNQPDLPLAANNRKYPNDECKLPHCNPYSTTGCPGPYCNSPEYANPGCASGNCGPKHNPIPGCAGPNCGRGQHQKPCAGPQCSGGPHANGEVEACSGPNCRGNYQQTPACTGPGCNGVIQVIPQNPPNHAPARPGCTDGSCLPKRPNVGPQPPIVFPQDDSDKSDWLPVQKPNPELDEHSPLNVGCNTETCDGDGKGSGGFSSADASSSSTANAGSGGHGGSGPGSYGNSFSNSFATASASASASAHSGNYGR